MPVMVIGDILWGAGGTVCEVVDEVERDVAGQLQLRLLDLYSPLAIRQSQASAIVR